MASNMDGVGTFEMADRLAELNVFTCLVKTYSVNELVSYFDCEETFRRDNVAMSIGIKDEDQTKFRSVYEQVGNDFYVKMKKENFPLEDRNGDPWSFSTDDRIFIKGDIERVN